MIRTKEEISIWLLKWFKDNKVKINTDKCHLLYSGNEGPADTM